MSHVTKDLLKSKTFPLDVLYGMAKQYALSKSNGAGDSDPYLYNARYNAYLDAFTFWHGEVELLRGMLRSGATIAESEKVEETIEDLI